MRTDDELRELFTELADLAPDPVRVRRRLAPAGPADVAGHRRPLVEQRHRPARPRRLARRLTLVSVLAALLLTAVVVPALLSRHSSAPADHRRADEWRMVGRVDPPPGWEVLVRGIDRTQEWTELSAAGHSAWYGHADCTVTVYGVGVEPPAGRPDGPSVAVNARRGVQTAAGQRPARVVWSYDGDAVAESSCSGSGTTPADALALARRTTFDGPVDLPVPFRLTAPPRGYRIESLVEVATAERTAVDVRLAATDGSGSGLSIGNLLTGEDGSGPAPGRTVLTVGPWQLRYRPGTGSAELIPRSGRSGQVFHVFASDGHGDETETADRGRLTELAEHVQPAADLADPGTWYPSGDALP